MVLATATPVLAQLRVMTYVSGLSRPVAFVQDPSDQGVQYVVEQAGVIRVIQGGALRTTPFLNIQGLITSNGEQGLLGLAFPPNYGSSGRFYVLYTRAGDGYIVVARYKRSTQFVADPNSAFPLTWSTGDMFVVHPYSNHNAGCLQFGPDGMLYISSGDGGSGGDPQNYAQTTSSLLGKMLRIDVSSVSESHAAGFVVPAGNAGLPRPEIWSLGWRNPWRFSFDSWTGGIVVADVGQGSREEVNYEPPNRPGRNYGWRYREGMIAYTGTPPGGLVLTGPIYDYGRTLGASVTGGYVYRGTDIPEMASRYVFADYVTRRVWSMLLTFNGTTGEATAVGLVDHTADLAVGGGALGGISAFGTDAHNELYLVDHSRGMILKLLRLPRPPTDVRVVR